MDDLFGDMFGKPSKSKKSDIFSLGDIGFDSGFGGGDLFGDTPKQKIFKVKGKNFIQDPRNPSRLVRLTKKNAKRSQDDDIFGFGGDMFGGMMGGNMFGVGDVGDQKGNVSILGNKKQMRETQESIDIISNDARRASSAIKKNVASIHKRLKRSPKIDRSGVEGTTTIPKEDVTIDDSGSTANDKEYCFQATKDGRSTVRCFRNSQIALRVRESMVSQGFSVSAIDEKVRR